MEKIKDTFFDWLSEPLIGRILIIFLGICIVLLITYLVKKGLNNSIKDVDNKYKARKAISFIGYIFMILVVLFVFNDKLGNIGVVLGVAGAGIAFALQELIISIAGWLNIMIANTVAVGQRIKVGEIKGDIIDIGILSTTVMEVGDWIDGDLYNGRLVSLSNSFVFKEKIHNYSAEYPFLWDELTIPIRLESDFELAREVFTKVVNEICGDYASKSQQEWNQLTNKYRVEEAQVKPMVTLKFDENWITFTLRYVVDYQRRRSTKDKIYSRLLAELKKHEGAIIIASSTLEITNSGAKC